MTAVGSTAHFDHSLKRRLGQQVYASFTVPAVPTQTIYFRIGKPITRTKVVSASHFDHAPRNRLGQQVYKTSSTPPVVPPPSVIGNPASILLMGY